MSSAFHLHIGGAGIRIGDMLWKLYDQEHNHTTQKNYIYQQIQENYHPYSLFVDLDDQIIQEVQTNNKQIKYKKSSFLYGKEEGIVYSRGLADGRQLSFQVEEEIRRQVETMDRLNEFVITASISGGTGSGLGYNILNKLDQTYGKKVKKNGFIIYPSTQMSNNAIEVYNAVLSTFWTSNYCDSIIMFDNQSMYKVIDSLLGLDYVDYSHLNNLIAQIISSYTGLRRFSSIDNTKILSDICPFPSTHYLVPSYNGMALINDYQRKELNQSEFIKQLTNKELKLYQCSKNPKHLFTSLLFRQQKENHFIGKFDQTLQNLPHIFKQIPRTFQCTALNYQVLQELAQIKRTATFFSNDASIATRFQLLLNQFDKLLDKRAFSHHFSQGYQFRQFQEDRRNLQFLMEKYNELGLENNSDFENSVYDEN